MKVQNFEHVNQFIITDRGNIFFPILQFFDCEN